MDTLNVISSPASTGGRSLCNSQAGPQLDLFGLEAAHASHSQPLAKASEPQTNATSGPCSPNSSAPASLQFVLANRLRQRLAGNGSPEYSLTWKEWAISGQEPICALRAVGRRTSGNASTGLDGWATPTAHKLTPQSRDNRCLARDCFAAGWPTPSAAMVEAKAKPPIMDGTRKPTDPQVGLADVAVHCVGWPTPGEDNANNAYGHKGTDFSDLPTTAQMAGRLTPSANEDAAGLPGSKMQAMLGSQCKLADLNGRDSGQTPSSSPAGTEKPAALNPQFTRWLMGFPPEWLSSKVLETLSSRKSRRSS